MSIPPSLAQPSFSQAPIETTDPNAISKTVVDAKGDLIAGTADNAVSRQAAGTDGTFLTSDSSQATGLAWVANPVSTAFDNKGEILVGTGSDTYTKLAVGTNNQVLVADSTQASGVRWSSEQDPNAIVKSIVDAKGDLIAATANDTPTRLPVGTDNQLLIADSTQSTGIKWGRPDILLGTETTGNYVGTIISSTGTTVSSSGAEGGTFSVAIGQPVGTSDTVAFGGLNVDYGTLYVDAANNRVGINDTTPSYALDVTGDGRFTSNLTVDSILYANHIHGNLAGSLYYHVKNNSGSTINIGTPVYITGTVGASGVAEVSPSRADTSTTMPAVGILSATLTQGAEGHMVVIGNLSGINTSIYSLNQPLYVGATGGLTNTRPTGASDVIQVIAYAARLNPSTGELIVNAYDQVRTPNSISVSGNIATTGGQFSGSGAGLTSIPAGQLTGTVPSAAIGNDTVALGTKTTGDYVSNLTQGTGVTITGATGEGSNPTIAIGQAVATTSSPQFAGLTTTGTANLNAASVTGAVTANSVSATTSVTSSTLFVDGIEIDTTGATSNQVLKYNGSKFAPSTGASVTISDTPPSSPQAGDQWYESDTGRQFIYYDSYWVEIGNATDIAGALQPGQVTALSAITSLTSDDIFPVIDGPSSATAASKITFGNLVTAMGTSLAAGMTLITTQTIGSAVSSVTVSNCFSATYDNYKIVVSGGAASADGELRMTLGSSTSGYYGGLFYVVYTTAATGVASVNNGASWLYAGSQRTTGLSLNIDLFNPFLADETWYSGSYVTTTAGGVAGMTNGFHSTASSYSSFTLTASTGTLTGGTIRVYGYRN